MRTYHAKPADISRNWHVVDAEGQTLGRLAARVASILRGKHKPIFTPHIDTGDHVIIINASKIHLTGDKLKSKRYYRHSGYPGGIHSLTAGQLQAKRPTELVNLAVRGMLPKNPLGKQMARKLRIYSGADHPHQAQQPKPLTL